MIIMPDFVEGELAHDGCGPDAIGYVPMQPAGTPTFVFVSITFELPNGAPRGDAALQFLQTVGSKTGQDAFNQNFLVNLTHTFNPKLISQSKFVYNRLHNEQPLGAQPPTPSLYLRGTPTRIGGFSVALPGYWMLFALNAKGVPSVAKVINIG